MRQELCGVIYQFNYKGGHYSIHEEEIACCYPSLLADGSYFFTLMDGTFFRGEQVREVMRKSSPPLERYRMHGYR